MAFFNSYPYTDFHELNADWLLAKMKELEQGIHIDGITDKEFIIIADSYGTGNQWQTGETTNPTWPEYMRQCLGVDSGKWHVNASDGSGFVSGYGFLHQLMDVTAILPDPDVITDIILGGGFNDYSAAESSILTAMESIDTYVKTNLPNAKIHLALLGWTSKLNERNALTAHVWPVYPKCAALGWRYLAGTQYVMHNYRLFCNDNFHPNQTGQEELGRNVAEAYLTGCCSPYYRFDNVTADAGTLFDTGTFTAINGFSNGQILAGLNNGSVTASTPITLTNGSPVVLGTISDPYTMMGNYYTQYNSVNVMVWIRYDNGTKYANCYGQMAFKTNGDHTVDIVFTPFSHGVTGSGNANDTFANVDIINWLGFTFLTSADIG